MYIYIYVYIYTFPQAIDFTASNKNVDDPASLHYLGEHPIQCVAMCCNVLQCVAVCCSVLQCVAMCCSVVQR